MLIFFFFFFWDQALRVIITVLQDNSFSWLWLDPHVNDSVGVCEALHSSSNPFLQIKTKSALQEPLEMRHEGKRRRKTKKRKNKEKERAAHKSYTRSLSSSPGLSPQLCTYLHTIRNDARQETNQDVCEDAALMGLVQNDNTVLGQHEVLWKTCTSTIIIMYSERKPENLSNKNQNKHKNKHQHTWAN